jgi:hypothetical protein
MACAALGLFFLQASPSPLLIPVHATADVASRARTRRVKSLIGKRILKNCVIGEARARWERVRGKDGSNVYKDLTIAWLVVLVAELRHC